MLWALLSCKALACFLGNTLSHFSQGKFISLFSFLSGVSIFVSSCLGSSTSVWFKFANLFEEVSLGVDICWGDIFKGVVCATANCCLTPRIFQSIPKIFCDNELFYGYFMFHGAYYKRYLH